MVADRKQSRTRVEIALKLGGASDNVDKLMTDSCCLATVADSVRCLSQSFTRRERRVVRRERSFSLKRARYYEMTSRDALSRAIWKAAGG